MIIHTARNRDKLLAKWALWLLKQDTGFDGEKLSILKAIDLALLAGDADEKRNLQQKLKALDKKH